MATNDAIPSEDPGENYIGPYERWNFGYGQPFAFPGIRKWKKYLTVLTEIPKPCEPSKGNAGPAIVGAPKCWSDAK